MTQEEKELVLKDLCARLSYGVMCQVDDGAAGLNDGKLIEIDISKELVRFDVDYYWDAYIDDVKPYLRPMSSMTAEEENTYEQLIKDIHYKPRPSRAIALTDWLVAHHFDIRNLIEKGLALEAHEGMYNLNNFNL